MRLAPGPSAFVALALVLLPGHAATAQQAQTHTVAIGGFKFVPDLTRARVGDTIVFVNRDVVPHTATQTSSGWDSGTLAKDMSWSIKLETAGTFEYHCRFHPGMKATLAVE